MYERILVPLDGSKLAEAILPHVTNLAKALGARVTLLQVLHYDPAVEQRQRSTNLPAQDDPVRIATETAEAYLVEIQSRLHADGITARTRVEYGDVVPTILSAARQEAVSLIALASHGRTGLAQVVFGSVATGLLHDSERPLLVIRAFDK